MFLRRLLGKTKSQKPKRHSDISLPSETVKGAGSSSGSSSGPLSSAASSAGSSAAASPKVSPQNSQKPSAASSPVSNPVHFTFPAPTPVVVPSVIVEGEEIVKGEEKEPENSSRGFDDTCLSFCVDFDPSDNTITKDFFENLREHRERVIHSISQLLHRICMSNGQYEQGPAVEKRRLHSLFYRRSEDTPIERALPSLIARAEYAHKAEIPVECLIEMQMILSRYIQKNTRLLYVNVMRLMAACLSIACERKRFPASIFSEAAGIQLDKLNTMRDHVFERLQGRPTFTSANYFNSLKLLDATYEDDRPVAEFRPRA